MQIDFFQRWPTDSGGQGWRLKQGKANGSFEFNVYRIVLALRLLSLFMVKYHSYIYFLTSRILNVTEKPLQSCDACKKNYNDA